MPHATTESDSALSSVKDNATTSLFTYRILPPKITTDSELAVLKSNLRELPARDATPTKSALWKSGQPRREISSNFHSSSGAKSDAYFCHDRWKIAFPSGQCTEKVEVEESKRRPGRFGSREWTGTDEDLFKRDLEKHVSSTQSYFKGPQRIFFGPEEARLFSNYDYPPEADDMSIWAIEQMVNPEDRLRVQAGYSASVLKNASQSDAETPALENGSVGDVSVTDESAVSLSAESAQVTSDTGTDVSAVSQQLSTSDSCNR